MAKVNPGGEAARAFSITLEQLSDMNQDQMTEHNKEMLGRFGGVTAVAAALGSNVDVGVKAEEAAALRSQFGENRYPEPPMKGFLMLLWESLQDATLIVLIVAAVVSLVVGLIEDPAKGWIEGVAIGIAICIVSLVTASNDYSKEQQFRSLNAVKDNIQVKIIRDGHRLQVSTFDLVVGDVVELFTGDKIPADGIYIRGDDCEANESSLTGEPEDLRKDTEKDPFLLSGCQITQGFASMLVIGVGVQSRWGRIKAKLAVEQEDTPLQEKLDVMATQIGKIGVVAAVATFGAMVLIGVLDDFHDESAERTIIHAFIIGITIVVVAIPEGLPLAVTISLAYSTKKMLKDNNLIRVLAACETMGNATNICSDKTGTLTENRMTVVEGWIAGVHWEQGHMPTAATLGSDYLDVLSEGISVNSNATLGVDETSGLPMVIGSKTEGALLLMLKDFGRDYESTRAASLNQDTDKVFPFSSAKKRSSVLSRQQSGGARLYVKGASEIVLGLCDHVLTGEGAVARLDDGLRAELNDLILNMAKRALRTICIAHKELPEMTGDLRECHEAPEEQLIVDAIVGIIDPLRADVTDAVSTCQSAGVMVRMVTGDNIHTAQAIARNCGILDDTGIALEGPNFRKMTPKELDEVLPRLQVLARSSPDDKHVLVTRLNGKALPKNREEWEKLHPGRDWETEKDLLLPGYREEWEASRPNGIGEVVGVTGDGTNDAPALKAGDVGLSMGLSGTDVAKEASDIVIMDDRFSSIVKAVLWGRCVYDNIRRFLQFQLTVNVVALTVTFIAAVVGFDPPLNAVMMLWVNLIMDTMGALALGTEAPTDELLQRRPYRRDASLVSRVMWRNILVQSGWQLVLLLVLLYKAPEWYDVHEGNYCEHYKVKSGASNSFSTRDADLDTFGGESFQCSKFDDLCGALSEDNSVCFESFFEDHYDEFKVDCLVCDTYDYRHYSIIFNAFVLSQVANEINARSIANDWRVFSGMTTNPIFIAVIATTLVFQLFVIEVGGDFTKTSGLNGEQWLHTILMGLVTLPLGFAMRFIPIENNPNDLAGYAKAKPLTSAGEV